MYAALLGRFCSRDPIGYEGSERNLTEYVTSNPLLWNDPIGESRGGRRNIRPSDIPAYWTWEQVEAHLKQLIARKANPKHIRAVRAWLKVLKRGGGILGPITIVLCNTEKCYAPELPPPNWRDPRVQRYDDKRECRCFTYTRRYTPPPWYWFEGTYGEWEFESVTEFGIMTAGECACKEKAMQSGQGGGGAFPTRWTECTFGGNTVILRTIGYGDPIDTFNGGDLILGQYDQTAILN